MPARLRLVAAHREALIEAPVGARLYDLIRGAGWPLGSSCRGEGICGRCHVEVSGPGCILDDPGPEEHRLAAREGLGPGAVLACLRAVAAEEGELTVRTTYW